MAVAHLAFGPFQMDLAEGRLRRGGHPVALPPRDFAVLRHLVLRPGQLVSADDLLDSVWADTFVVRGVVKVAIYRIRAALGDDAASASWIETVGRQGYRFVGEVRSEPGLGSPVALPSTSEPAAPPARREELDRLRSSFEKAILGRLQFVFVNGEDARQLGDLISSFIADLERESAPWCARARCVPQLGANEPYRPALEALQQLCRGPLSSEVVAILRRHAPLWLAELPGSVAPGKRESLPRAPAVARPERMQREFCEAALALASLRPLVLVLEDAQRSDPATLDLLWSLAARPGNARILVLATRGPDKSAASHAQLRALETELVARGVAVQLEMARRGGTAPAPAPFVGRSDELAKLAGWLDRVRSGTGRIGLITGEAGIGKTRLLEEFAAHARATGAEVLWGRCYEGDLARPFGAFAEAIAVYASESPVARLHEEVHGFGGIVAKIAPELRGHLPELPIPSALSPGEERSRQLDGVAQMLWAIARRAPLVLVLDDLHWADPPTVLLLRHAARFLRRHRVLILGAYRELELPPDHPIRAAQRELGREPDFESISLAGLGSAAIAELLGGIAERAAPERFVAAVSAETGGNPLFVRELLLHLLEEGRIGPAVEPNRWQLATEEEGVPDRLRGLVARRLSRLSDEANRLLAAASGCAGSFRLDVAAAVAGLAEQPALAALDEALAAQLVRETGEPEHYAFAHALIRHALYHDLSSARQLRLHRRWAEQLEARLGAGRPRYALEIARHWQRSAALPGAEAGVERCVVAAELANEAGAHEDAATAFRMALDLASSRDPQRPRLMARLGLALAWSLAHDEAVHLASDAADLLAASEGAAAAAEYLADAAEAVYSSSYDPRAWKLAEQGLHYAGSRRDLIWARLASLALAQRDANDPDLPGIPLDVPERREISRVLVENWESLNERGLILSIDATAFTSRADALERGRAPLIQMVFIGDYRGALARFMASIPRRLERGQLAAAALELFCAARAELALGNGRKAIELHDRMRELIERLGNPPYLAVHTRAVLIEHAMFRGDGYDLLRGRPHGMAAPENHYVRAVGWATAALVFAHAGDANQLQRALGLVLPAIERAPGWAANYQMVICMTVEALWVLRRTDVGGVIEANLREKLLAPGFRYPSYDARLSLARLCALDSRLDEARHWFGEARAVLDEQGARPLRAIVDFDEAWMEVRRGPAADRSRARELLGVASAAFEAIEMPGWLRRAREIEIQLESSGASTP